MKTSNTFRLFALGAGIATLVGSAPAAIQPLPQPPPSAFVDTESAISVPLVGWDIPESRISLVLATEACPTGAVQVAFGRDGNGNEDLEPEETEVVVGNDCGVWFFRDERTDETTTDVATQSVRAFRLFPPQTDGLRWNLAKVTTRGKGGQAADIEVEILGRGTILFVK